MLERIEMRKAFRDYHLTAQCFREILHGDFSSIINMNTQRTIAEDRPENIPVNSSSLDKTMPRVDLKDFAMFRDNGLVKAIKILGHKTMFGKPAAVFNGLEPEDAAIHNEFMDKRYFGPEPLGCEFHEEAKMAQFDALISGVGCAFAPMRIVQHSKGEFTLPGLRWADITRTWWDPLHAPRRSDWVCMEIKVRGTWIEEQFGEGALSDAMGHPQDDEALARPYRIIYYYDKCGGTGSVGVFVANGDYQAYETPLWSSESWYKDEIDEFVFPRLPVRFLSYLHLPGGFAPLSFVGLAFRAQLDKWAAQAHIRDAMEQRIIVMVREELIHKDDRANVINGEGGIVRAAQDAPLEDAIRYIGMQAVDKLPFETMDRADTELEASIGVSKFDSGVMAAGVKHATDTAAIVNQSQGTTATVLSCNAYWYGEVLEMGLKLSAKYDIAPIKIRYNDETLSFGEKAEHGPIGMYLRPDVTVTVSEDSLQYKGRSQQRDEAVARFQLLAKLPEINRKKLIEDVLAADGIQNIKAYVMDQPPAPMMPPGAPPMGVGAPMDPAAAMAPGGAVGLTGPGNAPPEMSLLNNRAGIH